MKLPKAAHELAETGTSAAKSNWLRAAVLGANDGIVSLAALVVGVAGATEAASQILITGIAGILAGALSMAVGEYVSVSSQRDIETTLMDKERFELENYPEDELKELATIYQKKGLSQSTAETVARELTAHDAFGAHVEAELRFDPEDLTNPWHAAIASALSFLAGAVIPLIAIMLPPATMRIPVTFGAVLVALVVTGILSAKMSGAKMSTVTLRTVIGGIAAMVVTFGIGKLFGTAGL